MRMKKEYCKPQVFTITFEEMCLPLKGTWGKRGDPYVDVFEDDFDGNGKGANDGFFDEYDEFFDE